MQDLHSIKFRELAIKRHHEMAPSPEQQDNSSRRSELKAMFCQRVAESGLRIANSLVQDNEWRNIFNQVEESRVRQSLLEKPKAMKPLLAIVERTIQLLRTFPNTFPENGGDPLLVFAIDEASSLLIPSEGGDIKTGLYVAVNRILSCLKDLPIWFFFISTESKVESLVPTDEAALKGSFVDRSSSRIFPRHSGAGSNKRGVLQRIPPFLTLEFDIKDRQEMYGNSEGHLETGLSEVGRPNYMALFGRPLWSAYTDQPHEMYHVARHKLIGGDDEYVAENRNHVFAALSFRLALDVCLGNPISLPLSRVAVNSYMRAVLSMDPDSGVLDTITPSEPILAKAAMEHLCKNNSWNGSIRTLTGELLEKGLVERGLKGELFTRLLLILAHDCVRGLHSSSPEYMAAYSVGDFLVSLYGEAHKKQIESIDSAILGARLNFNHFAVAGENLNPQHVKALCRDLLRRQAALQLSSQQPKFDILIPCHIGDGKIEEEKIAVIATQAKNKQKQTPPSKIFAESFGPPQSEPKPLRQISQTQRTDFEFNEIVQPILVLLFDLGVESPSGPIVETLTSKSPKRPALWLVHSKGHTEEDFNCLKTTNCAEACKAFFAVTTPDYSPHDDLARRNWVFRQLDEEYRYGGGVEGENAREERIQEAHDSNDENEKRSMPLSSVSGVSSGGKKNESVGSAAGARGEELIMRMREKRASETGVKR